MHVTLPHFFVILNSTLVDKEEIIKLYKRFQRLDKEGYGTINTDAFLSIPELSMNPLTMRIIRVFDPTNDDNVNFKQFVTTLSALSPKASPEEKLKCKIFSEYLDG